MVPRKRSSRQKAPCFEASEPVGMDGRSKFHDMDSDGMISALLDRRPPEISDEDLQAGNMLRMALSTDQL